MREKETTPYQIGLTKPITTYSINVAALIIAAAKISQSLGIFYSTDLLFSNRFVIMGSIFQFRGFIRGLLSMSSRGQFTICIKNKFLVLGREPLVVQVTIELIYILSCTEYSANNNT